MVYLLLQPILGYPKVGRKANDIAESSLIRMCVCVCVCVHSVMSDFCKPIDCNPQGSFVHGILQARILEWVAISSSWGSS